MTVSNVTTFSMTGDQIVNAALRKLSVLGDGLAPTATQLSNGTEALNAMLKTFMADGMPLWVISEYVLTPAATSTYTFGIGQTINIPAPLKVTQVFMKYISGQNTRPLEVKTHYDFNLLSNLSAIGVPTQYWYEPLNQTGKLHIWPTPDTDTITNQQIIVVYQRPFFDMVSGTDTLDFPQFWHEAIIYGLAWRLASEYGLPLGDQQRRQQEAEFFHTQALGFGTEEGSLFIMPDWKSRK